MKEKILLIDGHNYLFKSFFGVPMQVKRSDGTQVNAVYGFFSLLRLITNVLQPDYLLIFFDSESSTNDKKDINPEYKSNRPIVDVLIFKQLEIIKKCLNILEINYIEDNKYEADDLIGSYSNILSKDFYTYVCSNDNDFIQLVSNSLSVVKNNRGNIDRYNVEEVFTKFNVYPYQYIDYLSMVGDKSDNIKGIDGIGKKTASKLLNDYDNLLNIFDNMESISSRYSNSLTKNKEYLFNINSFLRIDKSINIDNIDINKLKFSKVNIPDRMGMFLTDNWNNIKI